MPKLVIDEIDVKLSKRNIIKLCDKNNITYDIHTNINGGKYIECIIGYDYKLNQSKYIDIYYNCIANRKLYKPNFTELKQFYIDLILDYFKREDNL